MLLNSISTFSRNKVMSMGHGVLAIILILVASSFSTVYHVAKTGADTNAGTGAQPFLTIQKAADVMQPGDSVLIHAGTYREWVNPPRGGTSESARITYKSAAGEKVIIKGSEVVTTWVSQSNGVWKVDIADSFFGSYSMLH